MPPAWGHRTLAQMALKGRLAGQDVVNVFAFEWKAPDDPSDALRMTRADQIVTDWVTNLRTAWLAQCSNHYTLPIITIQVVVPNRLVPIEKVQAGPPAGAVANDSLPPSTATIIRWRSNLAGKQHRGRTYVPGVPAVGAATEGQLLTAQRNLHQAFADAMVARYGDGSSAQALADFTVFSRPYDDEYYTVRVAHVPTVVHKTNYGGNSTHIISGAVDNSLRVQRRREVGVGT